MNEPTITQTVKSVGDRLSPTKYPAIAFITSSFVLSWMVIGFTIWKGEGGNTLHASAQSWSFVVILATLATFGLSSIPNLIESAKGAQTNERSNQ